LLQLPNNVCRKLFEEWGGHEAEDEDDQRDDGAEAAGGVEWLGVEDGDEAEEADDEEERAPNVPAGPEMKRGERDEDEWKDPRRVAVKARAQRAEDVAAVELRGGEEIERSGEEADPGGAAYRMKKNVRDRRVGIKKRGESAEDERRAEDGADVIWIGEAWHNFGVKYAEDECRDGDDEADERSGGADVEESAPRADRGADHDEGAEGADQRWEGNEIGIRGMDVMVSASEVVAELVNEQNAEKRQSEGESADERERMLVEKCEGVEEFIEVDGFVFGVGGGEVRAGYEAGAQSDQEEHDCHQEGF
jgi:hypothetical protein